MTIGILRATVEGMMTQSTSLLVIWKYLSSKTVANYTISYSNTNTQCFTDSDDITDITATESTLTGLQEGTQYSITVTVMLSDGGTGSDTTTATTMTTG